MNAPIDFNVLKTRQQTAWASGDYAVIGTTLQLVGELLAEACDLRCDERVLDVAAGNGNATLAAARRGGKVTSSDYVASLLERGKERARAERLDVSFEVADAEALPFEDASFDVVLSTFGVMFTPDHAKAAAEMARVCRPEGESVWPTGPPRALSARCSRRWDVICRHQRARNRLRCGASRRICNRSSANARPVSLSRDGCSTSGTARPRISSTCSAPGTDRFTRPSPPFPPMTPWHWNAI